MHAGSFQGYYGSEGRSRLSEISGKSDPVWHKNDTQHENAPVGKGDTVD